MLSSVLLRQMKFILCYGGPRMACHIGGERKVYVQQSPKLLEVTVYHPQSIAILRINGS